MSLVLALQQRSPSQWEPLQVRGWRLLENRRSLGMRRVLPASPSRGRQPSAPQTSLSGVSLSDQRGSGTQWHWGVTQAGGGVTPRAPRPKHRAPGPSARGAVCPPADAVAARKCLHGDGRSRAQGWRNTSGSGWWGEGPSGEGALEMGDGEASSLPASGREAFKPRRRGSEALVAAAVRGRPGCGTRGDAAQSA